ncbi:CLUMA_CG010770, isoform A [Clunio marinus]|uniref:CLUMA_CG010770, isoform A n=1 Tax=Clunio marinus TaxID=568069 RepID=A0A1J1ICV0_9DIPT|nr:CLUMA_CG010770, isoform A [Clunio marinus]
MKTTLNEEAYNERRWNKKHKPASRRNLTKQSSYKLHAHIIMLRSCSLNHNKRPIKVDTFSIHTLNVVAVCERVLKCKRGVKVSVDVLKRLDKNSNASVVDVLPQPPGPIPLPIIGNLALLGQYKNPFEGFTALGKIYGEVYSLTLGTTRCKEDSRNLLKR